jgi:hypothetical protein
MRVAELIEILEDMDPEAEVLIGSQENWPYAELSRMLSGASSSSTQAGFAAHGFA